MADNTPTYPGPRMHPDDLEAMMRAMAHGPIQMRSDVPTGIDAATIKRTVAVIIDDELSRRRVLSETEIREIAKDVAADIFREQIRGVEDQTRRFLPKEEIEKIVIDKLRAIGIRADDTHLDETRQDIEGLLRGYRRRNEIGTEFVREIGKALAGQLVAAAIVAIGAYFAIKGAAH